MAAQDTLAHLTAEAIGQKPTFDSYSNYQKLVNRAIDVFGDEEIAVKWLSRPSNFFEGQTPLQIAQRNNYCADVLEPAFIQIEHGIY